MQTIEQPIGVSHFKPYVGSVMVIRFPGDDCPAVVSEVTDLPAHPHLTRKPFSILFQTQQTDYYYPQSIFTVEHPELGALEIFLVPLGVRSGGMQYEAVFS